MHSITPVFWGLASATAAAVLVLLPDNQAREDKEIKGINKDRPPVEERFDWRRELDVQPPRWQGNERVNTIGMKLKRIPGGSYKRGGEQPFAQPIREVEVSAFWIGVHEVTNEQYEQFQAEHRRWRLAHNAGDDHPVANVTWDEAMGFCAWLAEKEGVEYRLPTDAEWEYAARGGLEGKSYPWGDQPPYEGTGEEFFEAVSKGHVPQGLRACVFHYSQWSLVMAGIQDVDFEGLQVDEDVELIPATMPVGSFAPNGFGLYDMAGNIEEACWDKDGSDYYRRSATKDPRGPDKMHRGLGGKRVDEMRIQRGGSFISFPEPDFIAQRGPMVLNLPLGTVGFRVAVSAKPWGLYDKEQRQEIPGFPDFGTGEDESD